jgi:hypothetical protein
LKTWSQVNYVFSTKQNAYQPLVNATVLALNNPVPTGYYEEDEGFANQVPIGFNFIFNNQSFSTLNVNANGFVTFGAGFTMDVNDRYSTNSLAHGPKLATGISGIIAPLWDDLWLKDTFSLRCKLEGTAPNRIFTIQWSDVSWNFNALDAALSFQLKLYETTNAIEFLYNPLGGQVLNGNASIGMATCSNCTGNFLSVGSLSGNTSVAGVVEFDSLNTKPAAGISYFFEPGQCNTVQALKVGVYNSRSANFYWTGTSSNGFDYAIGTSALQPLSFSSVNANNVTVNNLQPGTTYYMHVRSSCNSNARSGWVTYTFTTPCETTLPYKQGFEAMQEGKAPSCIKVDNPTGGNTWQVVTLQNQPPYSKALQCFNDNTQSNDAWVVLPAASLEGGKSYRLKFKYKIGDSLGVNQRLEIKIGTKFTPNYSGWNTIYKNYKLSDLTFKDTSLLFALPADNIYFIAFRCVSDKGNSSILIDDIELSAIKPIPVKIVSFTGTKVGEKNVLAWRTNGEVRNQYFELQKGADGEHFGTIAKIASKGINGSSLTPLDYDVTDNRPFNSTTYYRLRIVDADEFEYFTQAIAVKNALPYQVTISKMFPNPVSDVLTTVVTSPYNATANFYITDAYGKIVLSMPVTIVKGDNIIRADVSRLGRGLFMSKLACTIGGEAEAKSFIKQ